MGRWATFLLRALAALADGDEGFGVYAAVLESGWARESDAEFRAIVTREWGADAFGGERR